MASNKESYLSDRLLCPCNMCKGSKLRKRSICMEHMEDYGVFDSSIVDSQVEAFARNESVDFSLVQTCQKRDKGQPSTSSSMPRSNVERQSVSNPTIHDSDMEDMIGAFFRNDTGDVCINNDGDDGDDTEENVQDETEERLRKLASTPIFTGSRASILRACLSILNLQSTYGWSDKSVSTLLQLLKESFLPIDNVLPVSRDEAKKILASIGMDYTSIHACPKDCVLYRNEYASHSSCPKCGMHRYRQDVQGSSVPVKVLRHFPIIPRIQHMFRCKGLVELMSWHSLHRSTDGIMRVPCDSNAWQHIEQKWPDFAKKTRNIHLGLAMDGLNPFGVRSTTWSTWPVLLVNYNIPPWLTIKKGHLLLSLLLPGKYKVKKMDVYLQPLIEELQILWEGIQVFDMSKPAHRRIATIRGILMWTMHDYPGYGECTGLATSGYHACPICGPNLQARYSKSLKKMVYEGHVRYLPEGHFMRDGYLGRPPQERWSPSMQYNAWMVSDERNRPSGMNRLSILHQLPYWQDLLITSLLDPMHIFKNVGQTIWDHFIGRKDKGGWREDLKECHKEHLLHRGPIWSFTKQEDEQVKSVIKSFKTPTGHMHCLKGAFTRDNRLSGLKTHDWHKMLQYILPIAIKGCLTPEIRQVIYKISRLVRWISQKEISHESLEENRINAIEAVCLLEKNFPSSAMTIQVHLLVHIVDEVALAGVVHARWMFFLERFMKTLKGFVRQKARPEASMAEGWLVQESMVNIAEFLGRNDPLGAPQAWSNKEDDRVSGEVPQGNGKDYVMNEALREKVNRFCILNHPDMDKWRERYDEVRHNVEQQRATYRATCGQHIGSSNIQYPTQLKMLPKFMSLNWLDDALQNAAQQGEQVTEEEREFARGCQWKCKRYGALWSFGHHYRVHRIDQHRTTCDSCVMAEFDQETSSGMTKIAYYGTIQDILRIDYRTFHMFILDVKWFKPVSSGSNPTIRKDESGFIAVDSTRGWSNESDTYVLASATEQVIFHPVPGNERWWYVIQVSPRSKQIFAHPHLEELIDNIYQTMRRIGSTLPSDYGPSHQYLDEEELNDDGEGEGEDDDEELGDFQEGLTIQLYGSDSEIEDDLEDIDGSTIFIDVHARQELMDDENL